MRKLLLGIGFSVVSFMAFAEPNAVKFPENYKDGEQYSITQRGDITEVNYTSREVIDAVKQGKPIPYGATITMEDFRDNKLYRYVVMQKQKGYGADLPETLRNGEWLFQSFTPNKEVNMNERLSRCMACHKPMAASDYLYTTDKMKAYQYR